MAVETPDPYTALNNIYKQAYPKPGSDEIELRFKAYANLVRYMPFQGWTVESLEPSRTDPDAFAPPQFNEDGEYGP